MQRKEKEQSSIEDYGGSDSINACKRKISSTNTKVYDPDEQKKSVSAAHAAADIFYEKLRELNEPSGLSLIFNLRETYLDLYLLYKEVIKRGGFYQVKKDGKWNEVASSLNIIHQVSLSPSQVEKVYCILLLQFEKTNHGQTSASMVPVSAGLSSYLGRSPRKSNETGRNNDGSPTLVIDLSGRLDGPTAKKLHPADASPVSRGPMTPEQQSIPQTSSTNKELKKQSKLYNKEKKKDHKAPLRARTAYQMFLKIECERLKEKHGENSVSQNIRDIAVEAWRHLSETEKQPYVTASKKDKERFCRELAIYNELESKKSTLSQKSIDVPTPKLIKFGSSSEMDDGYYVTLQADAGDCYLPDEALVESAIQMMKNSCPDDPRLLASWDEYLAPSDIIG